MEDLTLFLSLGVISINKCHLFSHFGVAGRWKAPPKMFGIGTSVLREPQGKI